MRIWIRIRVWIRNSPALEHPSRTVLCPPYLGTPLNPSVAQVLAALAYQTSFSSLTAPEHPARTVYVLGTPLNPSVAQVLAALAYHLLELSYVPPI